ncbi:cytochrome P450 [Portibacter marinus]|uniref:cytochrome P450 n=1 Tax=Portibacter marinus TaxID=2898660 RepID=UPI001F158AE7|nr:cytochrome P450 [Portibacter marinus]
MKKSEFPDAFQKVRETDGVLDIDDQFEKVTMILRHKDVRKCAHYYQSFKSGVQPGRIVVPSEEKIREIRQIPLELDPPLHTQYRSEMEAWFRRPLQEDYELKLTQITSDLVDEILDKAVLEVVEEFALKLQSQALTLLLNVPIEEAEIWISWGTHVFRSEDNPLDAEKAEILYHYIDEQIEKVLHHPGDDLYSVLLRSQFEGRKFTKEEVKGTMILTFAGGRDTIINAVTNIIVYFGDHPESLEKIREDPDIIGKAVEEFIRYFSPLTHLGRVVDVETNVCEYDLHNDDKVSLCWASANRDSNVFKNPNEVILDRKMNPHVGFGFSHHKCLGATHARQLLKILIKVLVEKVHSIQLLESEENIETWGKIKRKVGFHQVNAKFNSIKN